MLNLTKLAQAIDHIENDSVELGQATLFDQETGKCCALGEMGRAAGMQWEAMEFPNQSHRYQEIIEAYGMDDASYNYIDVYVTNDGAKPEARKEAVLHLLRGWYWGEKINRLAQAVAHIEKPDTILGRTDIWNSQTGACCAIGEMLKVLDQDVDTEDGNTLGYKWVEELYALDNKEVDTLWRRNDSATNQEDRKERVLDYLGRLLTEAEAEYEALNIH